MRDLNERTLQTCYYPGRGELPATFWSYVAPIDPGKDSGTHIGSHWYRGALGCVAINRGQLLGSFHLIVLIDNGCAVAVPIPAGDMSLTFAVKWYSCRAFSNQHSGPENHALTSQKSDFGTERAFFAHKPSVTRRWAVCTAHPKGLKKAAETADDPRGRLKSRLPPGARGLHIGAYRHRGGFGGVAIYSW